MAITNQERLTRALDLLRLGLAPFVEREVQPAIDNGTVRKEAIRRFADDPMLAGKPIGEWDAHALLKVMEGTWNEVFRKTLGPSDRSLVNEIREWRNKLAHQNRLSSDDTERALDSMGRLLAAVSAPEADDIGRIKMDLRRIVFEEQIRGEKRKAGGSLIETSVTGPQKPWREVVTPHADVASGRYQQAEFAADLWQVHLGEGSDEYRSPREFFRRTYLTESLRRLLVGAIQRISGSGGDPVVQLQTNFGGGKTHSMLALYHLFSGTAVGELAGVDSVLVEAGVKALPHAKRVVLVGNKISPGNPVTKADGTVVRTLWGELAYQLGGTNAFARIAADDERATNPGDVLRELLKEHGPCLILIDEWVAYARQLHDQSDLPAGGFETQFTFAQALTESAKLAGNCLLVISLPASDTSGSPHTQTDDVEVGGIRGREALDRLRNVVGRVESSWRPATAEEGFEIVRRRLFEPLAGPDAWKQRDVTARAFSDLYQAQAPEFPSECKSGDYERRIQAAYPIHPEIFDRLYTDWSSLAKFQRTRGVLRLMASVIHSLWERGDKNPLILPSTIPIDDSRVQSELTRYLSDNWSPVIEKDVDGPSSLPLRIDADQPNLGKLSATRRVARTIYLGSAPTAAAAHRGIEDRRIKLGCVMPGEVPQIFGDALRRLAATATYLYQEPPHYWYSTQPTVTKIAEDRAEQLRRDPDKVAHELDERLRVELDKGRDAIRIHRMPRASGDVPDDLDARLVVLSFDHPYSREAGNAAEAEAKKILENRGNAPRLYRNALVFLAADKARLQDLDEAIRKFLAWKWVLEEKKALNLDPHQEGQAQSQKQVADSAVAARLPEAYQWLLVPVQANPTAQLSWQAIRLPQGDGLVARCVKRLQKEEYLLGALGANILRKHLDEIPLWSGDHVAVRQLVEHFARYPYLERLAGPEVLVQTIRDGLTLPSWLADSFAFAESYDEGTGRYRGLRAGQSATVTAEGAGLLVKSDVAKRQLEAEAAAIRSRPVEDPTGAAWTPSTIAPTPDTAVPAPPPRPRRFHGSVRLDPTRVGRDASRIADEVIAHLAGQVGAEVTITLEIEALLPDGASEQTVRTVTENGRTLKFDSQGFERD